MSFTTVRRFRSVDEPLFKQLFREIIEVKMSSSDEDN